MLLDTPFLPDGFWLHVMGRQTFDKDEFISTNERKVETGASPIDADSASIDISVSGKKNSQ